MSKRPGIVTVTIAGQTFFATPRMAHGRSTQRSLPNGTYPVVASVTDGAGNPGSASQQLVVDTVLPLVTLDGGPAVTTNDPTPTISGTSDAAARHRRPRQRRFPEPASAGSLGGTWNIRPATLSDGTRTVTASVSDPAGNEGTDSQGLTVDSTAPAAEIAGGATALTKRFDTGHLRDRGRPPGTTVTVTLADQTLTGLVGAGGAWSVTAGALSTGRTGSSCRSPTRRETRPASPRR